MILMPEVNNKFSIIETEFVRIDLVRFDGSIEVVTFSGSYKPEIIDGREFSPLGGMMSIGSTQRDLAATGSSVEVSISGIDQQNIFVFLSDDYRPLGSKLRIYRGFYDSNYLLTSTQLRHTGLINNVDIEESGSSSQADIEHTVSFSTESMKSWAEQKISGRATNTQSWKRFAPNDRSMDRVARIEGSYFDFGKKALTSSTTSSTPINTQQPGTVGSVQKR